MCICPFKLFQKFPPRILLKITVLLLIPFSGFAQFSLYRNLNVKDGLPSSEVYEMLEESTSYFWFATDMGVSRFNGYEFKNYTTEDGLPDNTIFGIHEDTKHRIWFRSASGKLSYFSGGKIFTIPANNDLASILQNTIVSSLYVDRGDTIWLGMAEQFLLKIEPGWGKQNIKKIKIPGGCQYIYEIDESGFIYGGHSHPDYVIKVFNNNRVLYSIRTDIKNDFVSQARFKADRLNKKDYLVTINNVIVQFNAQGIIFKRHEDQQIICSLVDENDNIIVGTHLGARTIHNGRRAADFSFEKLEQKTITAFHRDKEDELWICTKGHGIFYIPYKSFRYYTAENGLPESSIACVGVIGDKVVAGHLNGEISVFDGKAVKAIGNLTSNFVNEVTGILNFNERRKYISTIHGVYEFSPTTKRIKTCEAVGTKKLIALKSKNILSLCFRSLVKYDSLLGSREIIVPYLPYYSDNIYEDRNGTIWICSSNGLYTYNKQGGFQYEGNKDNPLLKARIVDMAEGRDNSLWMVSRGEGVIVKMNNDFFQIKKRDGLSSNMCRVLYMDSTNNTAWVGTNCGLNKITVSSYHPFRYKIENYYSKSGLLTNEVNGIAKYENQIWLAHNNGISVFEPDKIKNNFTFPPIYITGVLVNGDSARLKDLNALRYSENHLEITYNGLSYKELGKIEYKYKLEGLDTNWTTASNTTVNYKTLPSGTYTFIAYAKNNDGYLSSSPATLTFIIQPPWWQTWVFRLGITGIMILFVAITFTYGLNVIERREKLKTIQRTRLSTAELSALRAQMNPHFIFNAINSVQYFITNNDPKSSQKYLSKFAKLIRYVVDNSKPAAIPLYKELEALSNYLDLESLRFKNKFEYVINVNGNVDVDTIQIPSMLIQPYVENAIWHGLMHKKKGMGKINIQLDLRENILLCVIEDNGIGRKKSEEIKQLQHNEIHKSIGMSITKERLDIFNQINNGNLSIRVVDLEDEGGSAIGTRVELNIPSY